MHGWARPGKARFGKARFGKGGTSVTTNILRRSVMKKKIYRARKGSHINDNDAQVIGLTVERLSDKGGATAQKFVDEAKHDDAPTHYLFDWNDKRVAQLHREHQARVYMASVVIEIKHIETRAFIPEPVTYDYIEEPVDKPKDRHKSYLPIESILKNPKESEALIGKCKAEAFSWMNRWKNYVHLSEKFSSIQPVFKAIEEMEKEGA